MASLGMHMLASALALLGWTGALLSCIMPMWRVTAFIGTTIVTSETMWEGIWMSCVIQTVRAARALTVMSILLGAVGLVLAFIGGKCTIFMGSSKRSKARIATAAGVTLIVAGILCIIPVSWSAGIVVKTFYDPLMTNSQRREIGGAIYVGRGASVINYKSEQDKAAWTKSQLIDDGLDQMLAPSESSETPENAPKDIHLITKTMKVQDLC
ncbi:hypothetical protein ABG768_015363 [Culter alburnus]|uniref:Claudin-4-like n=1 Tax=Culter alburnus TaxID=194366 RepID=A0AAW1Z246_CULAL